MSWEKKNIALLVFTDGRNRGRDQPTVSLTKIHIRKSIQPVGLLRPFLASCIYLSYSQYELAIRIFYIFLVLFQCCVPPPRGMS